MKLRPWVLLWCAFTVGLSPALVGCAKRVPVETGAFEAQQRVALSFSGERSLLGKMDTASKVRYYDQGSEYQARIKSLSEETIVLEEVTLIQTKDSVEEVASRLSDARLELTDPLPNVVLSRSEIEKVERLEFDGPRTLKTVSFWTVSGVVLGLLLGERS